MCTRACHTDHYLAAGELKFSAKPACMVQLFQLVSLMLVNSGENCFCGHQCLQPHLADLACLTTLPNITLNISKITNKQGNRGRGMQAKSFIQQQAGREPEMTADR